MSAGALVRGAVWHRVNSTYLDTIPALGETVSSARSRTLVKQLVISLQCYQQSLPAANGLAPVSTCVYFDITITRSEPWAIPLLPCSLDSCTLVSSSLLRSCRSGLTLSPAACPPCADLHVVAVVRARAAGGAATRRSRPCRRSDRRRGAQPGRSVLGGQGAGVL